MGEVDFRQLADYVKDETYGAERTQRFDPDKFDEAIRVLDDYFEIRLKKADATAKEEYLNQQHMATIGHPKETQQMKAIIQSIVDENRLHDVPYPPIYESLVDALFHETWGLGAVSVVYERKRHIGKWRVNARNIWYREKGEKRRIHEQYRTDAGVLRMIENLLRNDDQQIVKHGREYAQLQMFDGTRVTITLPPMTRHPSVVFRRKTEQMFTLERQADYGTIAREAIPIYRMMSRCGTKIVLTGEPGTAKTTMAKALFAETKPDKVTIAAELVFELDLQKDFPDRDISEYEGDETNMASVIIPLTLRQDAEQYLMGEIREVEAPGFKEICANTTGTVLTTMHEVDSTNVPGTLARKELRQSSGMNYAMSLVEYASKIDFVQVMAFGEDQSEIRNLEVSSIEVDSITLAVSSRRIIWFDGQLWRFHCELDKRLAQRMRRYDPEAYVSGIRRLQELADQFPIPEEERVVRLLTPISGGGRE